MDFKDLKPEHQVLMKHITDAAQSFIAVCQSEKIPCMVMAAPLVFDRKDGSRKDVAGVLAGDGAPAAVAQLLANSKNLPEIVPFFAALQHFLEEKDAKDFSAFNVSIVKSGKIIGQA